MAIEHITPADGNIFADLGVPDAANEKLRLDLVIVIMGWYEDSGLNISQAAERLDVSRSFMKDLIAGKYLQVSLEKLVRMLDRAGIQVDIVVRQ